jgi:hypothetical protein
MSYPRDKKPRDMVKWIRLNQQKADTIRRLRKRGWLHREIADRYDIHHTYSVNICKGRYY